MNEWKMSVEYSHFRWNGRLGESTEGEKGIGNIYSRIYPKEGISKIRIIGSNLIGGSRFQKVILWEKWRILVADRNGVKQRMGWICAENGWMDGIIWVNGVMNNE